MLIALLSLIHILFLHHYGSSNPLGVSLIDPIYFYPNYIIKDFFGFLIIYGLVILILVFFFPNKLGHPINYEEANFLITPKHITPEWYFEPFYAILRSIPNKLGGVIIMGLAIVILF